MRNLVKQKIAAFLRKPADTLPDDMVLIDLVPESFVLVELVIELQEEFHIQLMQEDLKEIKTVGQLADLIVTKSDAL